MSLPCSTKRLITLVPYHPHSRDLSLGPSGPVVYLLSRVLLPSSTRSEDRVETSFGRYPTCVSRGLGGHSPSEVILSRLCPQSLPHRPETGVWCFR